MTGDEWGLVEVVPAENRQHYAGVARQFAEHHKDTEFSPSGWTTPPFILPGPAVPLSVRAIQPEAVTAAFANILIPTDRMTSCVDFTGPPEAATGCMAWKVPSRKPFVAGFYGHLEDGALARLCWSPHALDEPTVAALVDALAHFGASHRLLLAVEADLVIDFEDREAMAKYLRNE